MKGNTLSIDYSTGEIKKAFKENGVMGAMKAIVLLFAINSHLLAADDDVFLPFITLFKTWIQGNLGYGIALLVVAIGIIGGAFGAGFGFMGKTVVFGICIGAIAFIADKAFGIGVSFT